VSDEIDRLWRLHGLDEQLVAEQAALAKAPEQRRDVEGRVAAERTRLERLKAHVAELQRVRREVEREIAGVSDQERKFQSQLPAVKKNEEYTALLHEIAGAKQKRSDRETDLLMLMDEEERRNGEKPALEKALATAEAETKARLQALADQEQQEKEKVAAIEAERATLVAQLAAGTRSRYERIRAGKDGRAVAPIVKGACGGCYRGQPPQVLQEARRGDRMLICEGCGRILIWPPESGA